MLSLVCMMSPLPFEPLVCFAICRQHQRIRSRGLRQHSMTVCHLLEIEAAKAKSVLQHLARNCRETVACAGSNSARRGRTCSGNGMLQEAGAEVVLTNCVAAACSLLCELYTGSTCREPQWLLLRVMVG